MSKMDELLNMSIDHNMIDARDKFRPKGLEYKVQIIVDVNVGFLWAVLKCALQRKNMRITHTFNNDPFLEPDFDIDS